MEVKGIRQKIPQAEDKATPRLDEVFDEYQKKVTVANGNNGGNGQEQKASQFSDTTSTEDPLSSLFSSYLSENPMLIKLKQWMDAYYKEMHKNEFSDNVDSVTGQHLKVILYESLIKLLREIATTKDKALQVSYLQKVYNWFAKRERRQCASLRKEFGTAPTKTLSPHQTKALTEVPSKSLYEQRMRTLHPEIPPPKIRLEDYKRKALNKSNLVNNAKSEAINNAENVSHKVNDTTTTVNKTMDSTMIAATAILPPAPILKAASGVEWASKERKAAAIEAKSAFLYYDPQDPDEQKIERMWFAKKNKEIAEKRAAEELKEVIKKWGYAKARVNEELVRKHENVTYGNNFAVRDHRPMSKAKSANKTRVNYQEIYEKESSGEDEEEHSPYEESPVIAKRKGAKTPDITDLRGSMPELPKRACRHLPAVQKAIYEGDKHKVDYIRKMYGHLINATEDKMDTAANIFVNGPKGMKSLSIYNKDVERVTPDGQKRRQLNRSVPATHACTRNMFRLQQVKEINRIKSFLAKEEIPCSALTLQRAILMPDDYPADMMVAGNFPKPGVRLLVNPFSIKKKGKKGGKKGGKKK